MNQWNLMYYSTTLCIIIKVYISFRDHREGSALSGADDNFQSNPIYMNINKALYVLSFNLFRIFKLRP